MNSPDPTALLEKIPTGLFVQLYAWVASPTFKWYFGLKPYSPMLSPACFLRENYPEAGQRTFYCTLCLDDRGRMSCLLPKGDELGHMRVCERCKAEVQFDVHPSNLPGQRR